MTVRGSAPRGGLHSGAGVSPRRSPGRGRPGRVAWRARQSAWSSPCAWRKTPAGRGRRRRSER